MSEFKSHHSNCMPNSGLALPRFDAMGALHLQNFETILSGNQRFWFYFYWVLAESFYYLKYGSSIITSSVCQIKFSNENIKPKHLCSKISKIVSQKYLFIRTFSVLTYILSWKHLFEIYFRLLRKNNKLKINNFLTQ